MKGKIGLTAVPESQHVGVQWNKPERKWMASIGSGENEVNLGRFQKEDEAVEALRLAKEYLALGGSYDDLRSLTRKRQHRKDAESRWNHTGYLKRKAAKDAKKAAEKAVELEAIEKRRVAFWGNRAVAKQYDHYPYGTNMRTKTKENHERN